MPACGELTCSANDLPGASGLPPVPPPPPVCARGWRETAQRVHSSTADAFDAWQFGHRQRSVCSCFRRPKMYRHTLRSRGNKQESEAQAQKKHAQSGDEFNQVGRCAVGEEADDRRVGIIQRDCGERLRRGNQQQDLCAMRDRCSDTRTSAGRVLTCSARTAQYRLRAVSSVAFVRARVAGFSRSAFLRTNFSVVAASTLSRIT